MIIDLILDRKDGYKYNVEDFYRDCVEYGEVGFEITRALDSGTEKDVKQALCNYIIENGYNKNICKYINSVNWLDNSVVESKKSIGGKSLKEGIDVKIVYADDTPSEYIDDVTHNDILDIIEELPEVYKIFDVSGSKKKLVWSDEYGFERAYESKKSARKSLREFKGIETIDGKNKESDGNDYYEIALNLKTNEIVRIKNASCSAVAEKMACEYFNVPCNAMTYKTIKIFFMGTSPNLDLNRIPKKYHKYFNDIQ